MHVAEQVSIGRPPEVVVALLAQRPAIWLQPFLLLAWNEGESALRRLGRLPSARAAPAVAVAGGHRRAGPAPAEDPRPRTRAKPDHQLRLGDAVPRSDGATCFGILWTVSAADGLFRRLRGDLLVEPFDGDAVLSLRASYVAEEETAVCGTAHRPVELVVRSLLGHIRTAVE